MSGGVDSKSSVVSAKLLRVDLSARSADRRRKYQISADGVAAAPTAALSRLGVSGISAARLDAHGGQSSRCDSIALTASACRTPLKSACHSAGLGQRRDG